MARITASRISIRSKVPVSSGRRSHGRLGSKAREARFGSLEASRGRVMSPAVTTYNGNGREAYEFRTYTGYWACLADHVRFRYGDDHIPGLLKELRDWPAYHAMPKTDVPLAKTLRGLLLNGWTSELSLNLIDLEDRERTAIANHTAPVLAYYATSRHALAWTTIRTENAPRDHHALLKSMATQVANSDLYPPPWNLACTAAFPEALYRGFASPPGKCKNLEDAVDRDARAGMLLRTTRVRDIEARVADMKRRQKLDRAPSGEKDRQDQKLIATTVFDFAWRMRTRSNYDDPAMFYSGTLDYKRARAYADAIRTWTSATMFLFEALIAHRSMNVLRDAALHFSQLDRSNMAKTLIFPRLQALEVLD